MTVCSRALLLSIAVCAVSVLAAPAPEPPGPTDWPQWRGPNRTAISTETGLLKEWPSDGPKLALKITGLGGGYSTVSVVGGKIFTTGAKGQAGGKGKGGSDESVLCLDLKTGKPIWSAKIGRTAGGYAAPRSTPTVHDGRVYVMSSDGNLVCLTAEKGDVVWKKDLKSEFGGKPGGWAYAESPLIDGERLICTPGGEKATMVCLNKNTGKEIWRSSITGLKAKAGKKGKAGKPYTTAAYSSVAVGSPGGEKTYVQFLTGGVVGVSAKDGKLLWHYDAPANGTANISTPLVKDNAVFAASGYGIGGGRTDISAAGTGLKAKEKYFVKNLQNHHGGMVLLDGHIYGTNNGSLLCVNFDSGEVVKTVRGAGKGSIVYADGMIYQRGEDGTVCLVEANPKTLKVKGTFKQPDRSSNRAWAHPVVAGGKLFLRDWDTLLIYDIKAK
jgi:outer membrane protein assembly factor BamB